jgi:hypothetical protein
VFNPDNDDDDIECFCCAQKKHRRQETMQRDVTYIEASLMTLLS